MLQQIRNNSTGEQMQRAMVQPKGTILKIHPSVLKRGSLFTFVPIGKRKSRDHEFKSNGEELGVAKSSDNCRTETSDWMLCYRSEDLVF